MCCNSVGSQDRLWTESAYSSPKCAFIADNTVSFSQHIESPDLLTAVSWEQDCRVLIMFIVFAEIKKCIHFLLIINRARHLVPNWLCYILLFLPLFLQMYLLKVSSHAQWLMYCSLPRRRRSMRYLVPSESPAARLSVKFLQVTKGSQEGSSRWCNQVTSLSRLGRGVAWLPPQGPLCFRSERLAG